MRYLMFAMMLCLAGCQTTSKTSSLKKEPTLFTVGDLAVESEEFEYVYNKNNVNNDSAYIKADIDDYLDLYVKFKLKIKEAYSLGMDTANSFKQEFASYEAQLKKPYLTESKITEQLVQEAFNRTRQEVNASHILIQVGNDASPEDTLKAYNEIMSIRDRVVAGESFKKLAAQKSSDPSAKSNGGNLGYFSAFQMVYPFESAAYNTAKGEISMPARTRFGYHILKVLDKRPARGSVEVSHIMVRPTGNTPEDSVKANDKIFEIHEQATGGVSWDELASQFSDDVNSKNNGGRLRPFSSGQLPFEFQEAAFALSEPGQISDPVMTDYGWHIIRLEKTNPLPSFEDLEEDIRSKIGRDSRANMNRIALLKRLKKENGFTEYPDSLKVAMQYVDSTLSNAQWKAPELTSGNAVLFKVANMDYAVSDFLPYVEEKQAPGQTVETQMRKLYGDFRDEMIVKYEEDHLEEKYVDYRMLAKEYREGILLFQLMEEKVWSKASTDTTGLKNFFEENKENYQWKDRLSCVIYNSSDASILDEIEKLVNSGDSILMDKDALEDKFNGEDALKLQVTEGLFEKGENEVLAGIEWTKGVYRKQHQNRNNLIVVKEMLPAAPKKLSETKGLVISDYQNELEEKWVDQLRQKYPLEMNDKALKQVYGSLVKK